MATVASSKFTAPILLIGIGAGLAVGLGKNTSADPPDNSTVKAGDQQAEPKNEPRGASYPISELKLAYYRDNKGLPAIEKPLEIEVELTIVDGGYAAPNAGDKTVKVKLKDIGKGETKKIYASGISAIYKQIVSFFNQQGLVGVFVVVDSKDIDAKDQDVRGRRTDLLILIVTSVVKVLNTEEVAADGTYHEKNAERDASIRKNSPVKPAAEGGPDLLRKDLLDDYVLKTNKKAGMEIDVTVTGTDDPGSVVLTYLVKRNAGGEAGTEPSSQPAK